MPTLHTALTKPTEADLYRLSSRITPAMVLRASAASGRLFLPIDGTSITSKAAFLDACAAALHAPSYVGRNWDSLEEALRDLNWLASLTPPNQWGYVVLLDPAAPFIRHAPTDWLIARTIFQSAIDFWRDTPTPLTILLRRPDGLLGNLPLIAERGEIGES